MRSARERKNINHLEERETKAARLQSDCQSDYSAIYCSKKHGKVHLE
ncbi:hypothetical protein OHAE_2330 [Ochrobactrum soli]|uniref:Uncharacterized protein n=1 Tax=Ochrobactrum soli TaxID=2448455 RepID=A0A2P9HR73_9HYPH|nr:hypothetical protein OHAE_2905 [[Ochrobactrum] soli]SPL64045.1 hypothetical protein OHAE_3977 [[Ochrobactrum] soli]SPL66236.1 hypothetical protein OHAE_2103 [[Ochrobactrum] soli]SPL66463.1 hypothetical protein OHAE_2330 [[Ochrobactrum] soli]